MKYTLLFTTLILLGCSNQKSKEVAEADTTAVEKPQEPQDTDLEITPLNHATFVIQWNNLTIYNDPHGSASAFDRFETPDIILISDIHGDHLNKNTLDSLDTQNATFVVPQAVADQLEGNKENIIVLKNGEDTTVNNVRIEAIPMYNLPETADSRHPKGRGNGYILTLDEKRIYISGDTEDIEEMRALENIDIAFVAMNLPYTMSVEQAAEGVKAFAPKVVYPYHYRGTEGLSDVNKFKELVEKANKDIEVRLGNWYGQ